ncbi:hypothetical protein DSCOOX_43140 [Desulfosarcina ovata subsp. ovata]|uniref:Uncharacterized protein n=1 Tax=Desulfosarcina ovata subsp. ovata TaxID=2752305 RepID=A0A5K8AH06_9BACT|nr:hypothetical protein DSCOOX_43140 [Desulfosarcina ovata subsp. ovata]
MDLSLSSANSPVTVYDYFDEKVIIFEIFNIPEQYCQPNISAESFEAMVRAAVQTVVFQCIDRRLYGCMFTPRINKAISVKEYTRLLVFSSVFRVASRVTYSRYATLDAP